MGLVPVFNPFTGNLDWINSPTVVTLTSTQIAFGGAGNTITSSNKLTWTNSIGRLTINGDILISDTSSNAQIVTAGGEMIQYTDSSHTFGFSNGRITDNGTVTIFGGGSDNSSGATIQLDNFVTIGHMVTSGDGYGAIKYSNDANEALHIYSAGIDNPQMYIQALADNGNVAGSVYIADLVTIGGGYVGVNTASPSQPFQVNDSPNWFRVLANGDTYAPSFNISTVGGRFYVPAYDTSLEGNLLRFYGNIQIVSDGSGNLSVGKQQNFHIEYTLGNVGIRGAATTTSPLNISSLPTSSAGLATGDVWCDTTGGLNILKIK